jgi:hypothetical protein
MSAAYLDLYWTSSFISGIYWHYYNNDFYNSRAALQNLEIYFLSNIFLLESYSS